MALVNMKEMLIQARREKRAVGAFNIANYETAAAVLKAAEAEGDFTRRLITLERSKLLPFGAVWEYYCETHNMPGYDWLREIEYAV